MNDIDDIRAYYEGESKRLLKAHTERTRAFEKVFELAYERIQMVNPTEQADLADLNFCNKVVFGSDMIDYQA